MGWIEVGVLVQAISQLVIKNSLSDRVGNFIFKSMIFQFVLVRDKQVNATLARAGVPEPSLAIRLSSLTQIYYVVVKK
jgi:hypothetical protein